MVAHPNDIRLGDEVQCEITGFKGVAAVRTEYYNGMVQFEIKQRDVKDGEEVQNMAIDFSVLKIIKCGAVTPEETGEHPIPMRAVVKDKITGEKGTVTIRATFITGCHYIEYWPKSKKNTKPEPIFKHVNSVEIVELPKITKVKEPAKPTGGPSGSIRVQRPL